MHTPLPINRTAFHVALRRGDVPTIARYFAQPATVATADRAESWLATQPRDVIRRASLDITRRFELVDALVGADCGDVWFITRDDVVVLASFVSDAEARDAAEVFVSETVTQSWPVTMRWMLGVLATRAAERSDLYMLEMVFESTVFQHHYTDDEQQLLLRHVAEAWTTRAARKTDGGGNIPPVLLSYGVNVAWLECSVAVGSPRLLRVIARDGGYNAGYDGLFRACVNVWTASECAQILFELGADPRVRRPFGWRNSLQLGDVGLATMIIQDWCVDVDERIDEVVAPLMDVLMSDEFTALLLRNGADVSVVNWFGQSALSIAAQRANPSVVKLLLQHGADPSHVDHQGRSVLDFAKQRHSAMREVVDLLVQCGAK